jgi:cyclopropane fatty-acyl-phospholipid synthase-like methyltransferase
MTMQQTSADSSREQAREVADYYKWLHRWVRYSKGIRPASGFDSHAVHRLLTDPATGESGPFVVHRLMLEGLDLPPEPRVLDAGCGYGGTAFDLYPKIRGRWLGITLSSVQKSRARSEAMRRGLGHRVDFKLASYDDPLAREFDLVIAIESLVHSVNPSASVANLAASLVPGGYFVMVDDMPAETIPAELEDDLAGAKQFWRAPVMPTERGWRMAFDAAGLDVVSARDLSSMMNHRPASEIDSLIARDQRRLRWLGWTGMRMIPEASIGGLLLERLAAAGVMQYRTLAGRKRA